MSSRPRPWPAGPARHERPEIDEAALLVARHADRALAEARARGDARWEAFLAPLPDRLRDAEIIELRPAAQHLRSAFGPKDSIRDALSDDVTAPLRDAIDALLKVLARREAHPPL